MRIHFNAAARISANIVPNLGVLRRPLRMLPAVALSMVGLLAALGYAAYAVVRARRHDTEPSDARAADNGKLLEQLTHLRESGNLSDAEYTRQREKILATY
jgi:hypothetical protein